jgi:hypothetical protein
MEGGDGDGFAELRALWRERSESRPLSRQARPALSFDLHDFSADSGNCQNTTKRGGAARDDNGAL